MRQTQCSGDQSLNGNKAVDNGKDTPKLPDNQRIEPRFNLSKINDDAIFADAQKLIEATAPKTLADFESIRITKEKYVPHSEPIIKIGGKGIASKGNISAVSAQAKAGKSAFCGVAVAGAISKDGKIDGFNDLTVEPNPKGKAVIAADTEQAADDQQYNVNTTLRRAGLDHTPDFFLSYNFRQLSKKNYRDALDPICADASRQFGGIHLIVIDGGADFCQSINDDKEAAEIVEYFTHLAIKYDCPVIVVVHQNPGTDKERGHFGSEIQRKCYGLIGIEKKGDISTASVKIGRKAGTADTPLIHFIYSEEKGYHVSTEAPDVEGQKAAKNRERHREVAIKAFSPLKSYRYTDAVSQIMDVTNKSERTAKNMISNMAGWGYLSKGEDDLYRIPVQGAKRCKTVQDCT